MYGHTAREEVAVAYISAGGCDSVLRLDLADLHLPLEAVSYVTNLSAGACSPSVHF